MRLVDFVKWGAVLVFILIVLIPFSIYGYIKYKHYITEKKTQEYLIEYGYEDEDISTINSKMKKLSLFTAEVTFVDEPDITYDYKVENKKVIQLGPTLDAKDYDFKHLEED